RERGGSAGARPRNLALAEGSRVPDRAHLLHLLPPEVEAELTLSRHGLRLADPDLPTVALAPHRPPLLLPSDPAKAEGLATTDLAAWTRLRERLLRFARTLEPFRAKAPPRLGSGNSTDWQFLGRLGWGVGKVGRGEMREFLRIVLMNVADLVEDELDDPLLQGAVAFDGVLGTGYGPRAPGTVLTLLYRLAGSAAGRQGVLALP